MHGLTRHAWINEEAGMTLINEEAGMRELSDAREAPLGRAGVQGAEPLGLKQVGIPKHSPPAF